MFLKLMIYLNKYHFKSENLISYYPKSSFFVFFSFHGWILNNHTHHFATSLLYVAIAKYLHADFYGVFSKVVKPLKIVKGNFPLGYIPKDLVSLCTG